MIRDYKEKGYFIGENDYEERMKTEVIPFLTKISQGDFLGYEDKNIHYYYALNEDERATIVISHGFSEHFPKYHEMFYYFYQAGYSVFFIEHRGHGFSYREIEQHDKVHILRFQSYVDDLKIFIDTVVKKESRTGKIFLYSHSMGGCIASLYLEQNPNGVKAAVLSSPMLQLNFRGKSPVMVKLLTIVSKIAGWDEKFLPGQHGFDGINTYPNCSAQSEKRHAYLFEEKKKNKNYQTNGGTYKWCRESLKAMDEAIKNAGNIIVPCVLFQAGLDTMVEPGGQNRFLANNPKIEKRVYPNSKHEIFNALDVDRKKYYEEVLDFFASNL